MLQVMSANIGLECPLCRGRGMATPSQPCPKCGGKGRIGVEEAPYMSNASRREEQKRQRLEKQRRLQEDYHGNL